MLLWTMPQQVVLAAAAAAADLSLSPNTLHFIIGHHCIIVAITDK